MEPGILTKIAQYYFSLVSSLSEIIFHVFQHQRLNKKIERKEFLKCNYCNKLKIDTINIPFMEGGDIVSPGGGGGGGRVSLPVLMDLPLVGVLFAEATVGVELLEALLGGAGGGCDGRDLPPRLGVL